IVGAIQTLPGVQRNGGDQTGLMVRGGDVNESVVIVDGTVSQNAFFSNVPGVAQRSRFNPFQFKGIAFSSGGYSARYGQALSSVLDLQTNDLPDKTTVNLGANFAGIYASGSKLMDKNALEFSANYIDVSPFYALAQTNVKFNKVPQGGGFSTRWISQIGEKGMFKMNFQHSFNKMNIVIPDPATPGNTLGFGLNNENTFFNSSYRNWLSSKWSLFTALSYSSNADQIRWGALPSNRNDSRLQGRAEIKYFPHAKFETMIGAEVQRISYAQRFDTLLSAFEETLLSSYLESEWKPIKRLGFKIGLRAEHSKLINRYNVAPRGSMAYKTGRWSQVSFATGLFYQTAPTSYLLWGYRPGFQSSVHYMANYQWLHNDRTFRVEGYYKGYDQLIRENGTPYNPNAFRFNYGQVNNAGDGYAQGIDFFWRDKKTLENLDYWISYSFIDTKRIYQNYVSKVTPDYVSPHNLSIVSKYFVEKLQMSVSLTYNYATGRGYYNPNTEQFLGDKAPDYHNVSLNLAYLTTVKKVFMVIYMGVDNITNQKNVLGFRYSNDGVQRYPILPPLYRSVFLGVNMSLTKFNKDEL
ncbi:MAG TPA: TonB-dependent receptor plug domain-containing protein, partial [Cytophagales bacterium]|nr:TonB-dependent receptor plug domain-containing protein [Cytophagales bacterium]